MLLFLAGSCNPKFCIIFFVSSCLHRGVVVFTRDPVIVSFDCLQIRCNMAHSNTIAAATAEDTAAVYAGEIDAAATATPEAAEAAAPEVTAETAGSNHIHAGLTGSFQFTEGDEAMFLGPDGFDYVTAPLVTVTSTSVALAKHVAFVVHDIMLATGKVVEAVPRHRLRRLAKMPASVVSKVRSPELPPTRLIADCAANFALRFRAADRLHCASTPPTRKL